ncbi:ROK family protein [Gammaproteobacteria bacterium AS21]
MDFYWTGAAAGAKILDIIRDQGPISRAALCRITQQARSTMSLQVEQLLQLDLIEEVPVQSQGQLSSNRVELQLSDKQGVFLAIYIGLTHFKVALCHTDTRIISYQRQKSVISDGPAKILNKVFQCITLLLEEAGVAKEAIISLGLAISGPVDYRKGIVSSPVGVVSSWHNYPIRAELEIKYQCPVVVDNDVHAMALGEQQRGLAGGCDDFIMVKLSLGIGASIVADGKLYRGAKGVAGFISHNQVEGDTTPCICGKLGCLEVVAGGAAMAKQGMEAIFEGKSSILVQLLQGKPELDEAERPPQIAEKLPELLSRNIGRLTAADIAIAADMGDSVSFDILQRSAQAVGAIMAQQVNFNNPSLLVLAGELTELGDSYLSTIRQVIFAKAMPLATSDLAIKVSELADMQGLIGACRLAQDKYYAFDSIKQRIEEQKAAKA